VYNIYRELEEPKGWKISRRAAEPQRKRGDEAVVGGVSGTLSAARLKTPAAMYGIHSGSYGLAVIAVPRYGGWKSGLGRGTKWAAAYTPLKRGVNERAGTMQDIDRG
jgi:hypothetical protein